MLPDTAPAPPADANASNALLTAWSAGNRNGAKVLASEVDKQMKADRTASHRVETASLAGLPDGVIVKQACSDTCYLVRDAKLHPGRSPATARRR